VTPKVYIQKNSNLSNGDPRPRLIPFEPAPWGFVVEVVIIREHHCSSRKLDVLVLVEEEAII
jgi:hypothetical protein